MRHRLTREQISHNLGQHPLWRDEGNEIVRDLKFKDFAAALAFVNLVGAQAEEIDHHPDISLHGWNNVRLRITTHSEGGLTDRDFELAGRIDEVFSQDE